MFCRSAAKVNLSLDVLARRADGYHTLQSVVHGVGLWDELHFDFDVPPGLSLRCNVPALETDDNLCLKAARALLRESGALQGRRRDFPGLRITLRKNIPTGAGLGGGSGNAAATLLALNRMAARWHGSVVDDAALHRIAASLGADVPFFLQGGCALIEGVGEIMTPLPPLQGWLLVVQPPTTLSTPQVFAAWDALAQPSARATPALRRLLTDSKTASKLAARSAEGSGAAATRTRNDEAQGEADVEADDKISEDQLARLANKLHNDLAAAAQQCGVAVEAIAKTLRRCGAPGASMTGSGSAVFGLFASEEAARRGLDCFRQVAMVGGFATSEFFAAVAPLCSSVVAFDAPALQKD